MRYANFDLLGKTDDKEDSVEWLFYVDVYKRQCLENQNDENIAKTAEKQKKNFAGTEISGKKLGAVSYTHLDVYKRQFLYNAVCDGDCRKWEKRQDKRDVSDGDNFGSWAGIDL